MPAVMWQWSNGRSCDSVGTVMKKIMIVVGYWCYEYGVKNRKENKKKRIDNFFIGKLIEEKKIKLNKRIIEKIKKIIESI